MKTGLALITLSIILLLSSACNGDDDEDVHELIIELRAGENAPSGFGFGPGDALERSEVSVELLGADPVEPDQLSGTTDDAGHLTFEVDDGSYEIVVSVETTDPLCVWLGGSAVTVSASPTIVTLDDMQVACQ